MKFLFEATVAAALLGALPLSAVEVDGVAARVGSAVILRSDVLGELRRRNASEDRFDAVREEMIERELVLKAAKESKMSIQEWVVDNNIRGIIERAFGGDRNKLMETLAKERISYPEWRQRMRDDMVVGAMRYQIVEKNVSTTPAALRAEYEAHPERYAADRRVTVSAILLGPDDAAKKAEVDEGLKTTPFAELARTHSADSHAKDGGQWKDVRPEEVFRPEICAAIDKLKTGETSPWIELDGWNFLLRKDGESGGDRLPFADAYEQVAARVRDAEARRLYTAWIARLKEETYIKVF